MKYSKTTFNFMVLANALMSAARWTKAHKWPCVIALLALALLAQALKPHISPQMARLLAAQQEKARLFAGCGPENQKPFDGKLLYKCVFNHAQTREFSLIDAKAHQNFVDTYEHKHDHDGVLENEDQAKRAIVEMVASLHQPHTQFLDQEEFINLRNGMNATLSGVGAYVMQTGVESRLKALGDNPTKQQVREATKISADTPAYFWPAPLDGGPAALAGIKGGDRFKMIGPKPVDGLTLYEASKALQGAAGSKVHVVVERDNGQGMVEVSLEITRATVAVPLITTENLDGVAPASIAALKIAAFASGDLHINAGQTVFKLCTGVHLPLNKDKGIDFPANYDPDRDCKLKGLVLDFRNDGGGRVDYATKIPQLLIDHGPIVSTFERKGDQIVETKLVLEPNTLVTETFVNGELTSAKGSDRYMSLLPKGLPMVVLINGHSASASEMVARMLQINGAVVVGTSSYGKKVGQELIPLAFGTAFKTTILEFKPGDEDMGAAVIPDVEVEQSTAYLDDPRTAEDVQMTAAVAEIHKMIASAPVKAARQQQLYQQHANRDEREEKSLKEIASATTK